MRALVLFDGDCGFCTASVRWIARRDRRGVFCFAPLRSRAARQALEGARAEAPVPDSLVIVRDGAVLVRSDATIAIARMLGLPWSLAAAALLIPRALRDGAYSWIARRRHRLPGAADACPMPDDALRARLLDDNAPSARV